MKEQNILLGISIISNFSFHDSSYPLLPPGEHSSAAERVNRTQMNVDIIFLCI